MTEQFSEGTGEEMQGTEHPADGTWSPEISNGPRDLLAELDSVKAAAEEEFGKASTGGVTVTVLHRFEEHFASCRADLEELLASSDEEVAS